ncbi:MAG: hydrolase [Candidatus Thermoplasmatota archaeon]|nr:hydrolase [Candidatus Thermoplasmatota archaeon]
MEGLNIAKEKTALVLIDLQKGIVGRETKPYSASTVVSNATRLVKAFRKDGMPVFLVHVNFQNSVPVRVESDSSFAPSSLPPDWSEFVPDLEVEPSDIIITKRQWGAFTGTDLEQQLRRRKLDTIIMGGIATTYGVESTARFAYELGFNQVFAEDAMTDMSEEAHKVSVEYVLKRMGKVRITETILEALR